MVFLSAQEPAFAKSPRAQRGGSQAPAPEAAKDKIVPVRSSSATAGALRQRRGVEFSRTSPCWGSCILLLQLLVGTPKTKA